MSKINFRGGFSDRNKIKPINTEIQLDSLDERTRVKIYNLLNSYYNNALCDDFSYENQDDFCRFIIAEVFVDPFWSKSSIDNGKVWFSISECIKNDDYDEVLTLIEASSFALDKLKLPYYKNDSIFALFNKLFTEEFVGYRFVDKMIVPISDDIEVNEINEVLCSSSEQVNKHISKSLKQISDKKNPDYENSIKESITAVEAKCSEITKVKKGKSTLGKTLNQLEANNIYIHKSLKSAFEKLYGYSCDANGVRHAGDIGGPDSTFGEAKFMLVSCCAFINYLTVVQSSFIQENN